MANDLYTVEASKMFDCKPEEVTPKQRAQTKVYLYGLAYSDTGRLKNVVDSFQANGGKLKCNNPNCSNDFNRKEVARVNGELSSPARLGYCSAACYTKSTT
ncbi:hypothetical protein M1M30_gp181 [Maribacter phage Colly_1]|uniref:Uncharacterized protein n=1 Tax=Maribacter phage Colly_1 TaxID=2745691 RepID=A0A8E4UXW6_9CAUD|nr:hypothetical protein M1M30_gp181 [Maribacter phage Colly_1]QQO97286.1 hypothetical protein Colly1_181 [Maribacter phage Colly_1]